jgi:hypothetical protein
MSSVLLMLLLYRDRISEGTAGCFQHVSTPVKGGPDGVDAVPADATDAKPHPSTPEVRVKMQE